MSNLRRLSDALILPFTLGLIAGGAATGFVICFGLGEVERLVGGMNIKGIPRNPIELAGEWLFILLLFVFIATLLEFVLVSLAALLIPFPLSPRLPPTWLFIVGAVAASGCTIASCLTIDLALHPELHFRKGPEPPLPLYLDLVCLIAPLLLLRRDCETPAGENQIEPRAEGPAVHPAKGAALEND